LRIEHATRDVDVSDRIAVKQNFSTLKVVDKESRETAAATATSNL